MAKKSKTKIAVLVSGGGTNLQALIDAEKNGIIKSGKLSLVISNNPAAYAITRAELANIPVAIVVKKEYGTQEAFEKRMLEVLAEHEIDMIVLAGFIIGSLVKIWPWNNLEAIEQVESTGSMQIGWAIAFALIGFCLVSGIELAGKQIQKKS